MSTKKQPAALRPCGPNLDPHQVIVAPLVTEKMNAMAETGRTYAFQVNPWARLLYQSDPDHHLTPLFRGGIAPYQNNRSIHETVS